MNFEPGTRNRRVVPRFNDLNGCSKNSLNFEPPRGDPDYVVGPEFGNQLKQQMAELAVGRPLPCLNRLHPTPPVC